MEYSKTKDILHVMKVVGHIRLNALIGRDSLINIEDGDYFHVFEDRMMKRALDEKCREMLARSLTLRSNLLSNLT